MTSSRPVRLGGVFTCRAFGAIDLHDARRRVDGGDERNQDERGDDGSPSPSGVALGQFSGR